MKSLSAALQAHLDSGTTTLAWCWRIERADGVVFGFTDHDRPLQFGDVTYEPESGFAPNVVATAGPLFSTSQLIFAGAVSLVLFGSFIFVQTVRHRDYFLPLEADDEDAHASMPSNRAAATSAAMLVASLVAVVGLAKSLTPTVEAGIDWLGVPKAVVGIVIAGVVLLPECLAAGRAAQANRLQTSLNLALGSVLAAIGLTIPAVALVSIVIGQPLELGLDDKDRTLLVLTLIVSVITLGTGRTTVLQGMVHLVIFVAFLFFAVVP